jgi:hypothetical protein|nr:MAG TPA: DNA polymerase III [Caudoviricetes sp.]
MTGQEIVKSTISKWEQLPKFIIIEGQVGSGRKTLVRYIASKFDADSILVGTSVDDIRNIIEDARSIFKERIYVIDGNSLSMAALNSLLKIAEEPPSNCHIAMTVDSINNALPTLASRAKVLSMLPYTNDEKMQFVKSYKKVDTSGIDDRAIVDYCNLASNLQMLEEILLHGADDIFEKVTTFYDLIWEASASNSLKVTNWLKFKETDEGKIEPKLFLNCLLNWSTIVIRKHYVEMTFDELQAHDLLVREASRCLRKISRKGSNARVCVNDFIRRVKKVE